MKNLKVGKILSSGQKQGENTKTQEFSQKLGRLGSYALSSKTDFKKNVIYFSRRLLLTYTSVPYFR